MKKADFSNVPDAPEGGELPLWVQVVLMALAFVLAGVFGWWVL